MAEYDKSTLLDLSKQAPNNRCMDCGSPHPQWASVNHGTFICLECSGEHRSLGVHISFVRSLTMDKWTPEQIKKMQEGGNAKATAFFQASPDYSSTMSITQKYNTHFAAQYREKLVCDIEGRAFVPSAAPPPSSESTSSSLRKPRVNSNNSGRASPNNPISRSNTPLSSASAVGGQSNPYASNNEQQSNLGSGIAMSQKTANENYFAGLGQANANRSTDLPPSQGGKYTGFGSSPMPSPGYSNNNGSYSSSSSSSHPSNITSSRALPSLNDLQTDPLKAMSKGWGLFSNTLSQATKTINESVIQPGLTKINDPNLQTSLQGYYTKGGEFISYGLQQGQAVLGEGIKTAGDLAKSRGIDTSYLDRLGNGINSTGGFEQYGGGATMGYSSLSQQQQQQQSPIPHQTSLESQEAGFADLDTLPPVSKARTVNQTYPSYGTTTTSSGNKNKSQQEEEEEDFFDSHLKDSSNTKSTSRSTTPSIGSQSVEDGFKSMNLGSSSGNTGTTTTSTSIKRPIGKKGLGAVRSATPPTIAKKKDNNNDDDEWAKFD